MKNILLTGATGFLGNILVKSLFNKGYSLFVLARPEEQTNSISNVAQIIRTDYSIPSLRKNYPYDIDVVIHLAWSGVNGPLKGDENVQQQNIELALRVAAISKERKTKRFIGIGTITELAYLNNKGNSSPSILYGRYKYKCFEELASFFDGSGTTFLWLRLANLYSAHNLSGNILGYTFGKLMENQQAEFGPCDQYYDFVYVEDEIDAISRYIELNRIVNNSPYLGSNSPQLLRFYIETIGKLFKKKKLLKIGAKETDNIAFCKEMFDCSNSFEEIGNYISLPFEERILQIYKTVCKNS